MNRSRLVACLLLVFVVFLACSCAAPVCAARPLDAAAGGDARRVLAADGFAAVSRRMVPGKRRRLLGTRTPWLPPPPLPNKTRGAAMNAPPPPIF